MIKLNAVIPPIALRNCIEIGLGHVKLASIPAQSLSRNRQSRINHRTAV
jgi:hypothetical protein